MGDNLFILALFSVVTSLVLDETLSGDLKSLTLTISLKIELVFPALSRYSDFLAHLVCSWRDTNLKLCSFFVNQGFVLRVDVRDFFEQWFI